MGIEPIFDPHVWARVPFHFWTLVMFVLGCIVGSFLNVVIHRLPAGESIVSPPSHCPHCKYSIPWYLNVPLVTWLYLGGKCRNCGAPISARYFLVELLTGATFASCWVVFGWRAPCLALIYCLFLAGMIAGTFIDFEHFIIPDEITIGGMVAGFFISFFYPALHGATTPAGGMMRSALGMAAGAGVIYLVLRLGKLLFGRQRIEIRDGDKIVFGESALHLPGGELAYDEIFYRRSDAVVVEAKTVELVDRCYRNVPVRLALLAKKMSIGGEEFDPEHIVHMELTAGEIVIPREAMGFGDVKFMAAIGAFLGWQSVLFSLLASSIIGSAVGVTFILFGKREWSSRLPYVPYISIAATIWIFAGARLLATMFGS